MVKTDRVSKTDRLEKAVGLIRPVWKKDKELQTVSSGKAQAGQLFEQGSKISCTDELD